MSMDNQTNNQTDTHTDGQTTVIYVCEDSLEGIFTGVYRAYAAKRGHAHSRLTVRVEELELFAEYETVEAEDEKAWKVSRTICDRLGYEVFQSLCRAAATPAPDKADAIYKMIVAGLSLKNGPSVINYLSNPYVARVFEMNRNVNNEVLHVHGFLRFKELKNGVLFSEIGPKNDILTIIAPHFADRFPQENFMIYDSNRKSAVIHQANQPWVYSREADINIAMTRIYSGEEEYYEALFTGFCQSIAIKERENLSLQQQMLPLRFQKYMVEFEKKGKFD